MNQEDREKILLSIDEKKFISNEDLFLYDLTPYYNFNELNDSLFHKIINYHYIQNRMKHNPKISFTPEQKKILKEITINGKYAISATTSFGKTTIIKEYIKIFQPNIVVFVVPTNSLSDELLTDFELIFEPDGYDIIDTSVSKELLDDSSKLIFIGTQEKLADINWLKNQKIDLFVIDEAYKLKDKLNGYREISLNRIFLDYLNNSTTFILLLPLVNNIIGLDKYKIKLLKTDYSPVAKTYEGIDSEEFDKLITEKILNNDEKSLVYFPSPSSLEDFFWNKIDSLKIEDNVCDDWIKRVERDFHEEWFPVIAYKKGIAIHYGNMPKFIQIKMVKQFNKTKTFNTILSTSSLIEGVNTPTKNIYIKDHGIFSVENRIKYKNLIGRAGRLNVTPVGKIFYDNCYQREFEVANMNWQNIDLKLIIEEEDVLEEINREEESQNTKTLAEKYKLNNKNLIDYLEKSGITVGQLSNFIENLISYNTRCETSYFPKTTPELMILYNKCYYSEKRIMRYNLSMKPKSEIIKIISSYEEQREKQNKIYEKSVYDYLKKLLSATINPTINKKKMFDISSMLEYINNNINKSFYKCNNSRIISSIIGMVYNFLPYELMPFLENIVDLNNLFKESGVFLLNDRIINYINDQIGKYNIKYFGKSDCSEKERKIIKRLFEYGIPYSMIKDDIEYFVSEVNDNFSINHIKKAISKKEELKNKLNKYFE